MDFTMRERCSLRRLIIDTFLVSSFLEGYEWQLSLYAFAAIMIIPIIVKPLFLLIPGIKQTHLLNKEAAAEKMTREYYAANQKRTRF